MTSTNNAPLWAVALVFAAPAIGDRPLPGGGGELKVVHVICVAAIVVTGVWALSGRLPLQPVLDRPLVRAPLLFGAAFVLVAGVSTLMADNQLRGLKVTATFAAGWLLIVCTLLVATTRERLRTLLGAAVVGSLTVTLPILSQSTKLTPVYGGAVVRGRAQSIFADPNQFGSYAALIVLLAVGWFVAAPHRWERGLAVVGGSGASVALVLSLSRGAWLGTAAGLLAVAIVHPAVRRALVGAVAAGVVLALVALLAGATAPLAGAGSGKAAGLVEVVADRISVIDDRAANPHDVRPVTWREAIRQFRNSPVLGNGPGSFSTLAARSPSMIQFQPRLHAHNALLHTAAELGLVGLAAGLGLAISCAAAAWSALREVGLLRRRPAARIPRRVGVLLGAGGALIALSVHLMVDYPIRNPVLMIAVWSVAGLLLASTRSDTAPKAQPIDVAQESFVPDVVGVGR